MNLGVLKSRKIIAGIAAAVIVVAGGATAVAVTSGGSSNDNVTGAEKDRVVAAATAQVPGTAVKVEREDAEGKSTTAFEVKVKAADGTITEVELSKDLKVVKTKVDNEAAKLTPEQQTALESAVATVVPDGKVIEVESTSDHGAAYEAKVEVTKGQTVTEYDVYLDTAFKVVHHEQD